MSDDGTTHSDGHLRSLIFQAKVDAAYLHRGLELVPPVITRHKLSSEVVELAVRVCNRLSGYSGYSDIRKNLSVRIVIQQYSEKSIIGFVLFEITGL